MSCNFNAISCKNCPKYNACLLQIVYANTLTLAGLVEELTTKYDTLNNSVSNISPTSFTVEDNIDMFSQLEAINTKLDNITKTLENEEEQKNERIIDFNNMQSTISSIDSKLNDLIKSYNSYEYIPMIEKE